MSFSWGSLCDSKGIGRESERGKERRQNDWAGERKGKGMENCAKVDVFWGDIRGLSGRYFSMKHHHRLKRGADTNSDIIMSVCTGDKCNRRMHESTVFQNIPSQCSSLMRHRSLPRLSQYGKTNSSIYVGSFHALV